MVLGKTEIKKNFTLTFWVLLSSDDLSHPPINGHKSLVKWSLSSPTLLPTFIVALPAAAAATPNKSQQKFSSRGKILQGMKNGQNRPHLFQLQSDQQF